MAECSQRGVCTSLTTCACFEGYTGQDCAVPVCPGFVPCSGHGECVERALCTCQSGFSGPDCSVLCGDGATEGDEQCDDGNANSGDGCSAGCVVEAGAGWRCAPRATLPDVVPVNVTGVEALCLPRTSDESSGNTGTVGSVLALNSSSALVGSSLLCTASVCAQCGNGAMELDEACDDGGCCGEGAGEGEGGRRRGRRRGGGTDVCM